jgi:hypothetical protein
VCVFTSHTGTGYLKPVLKSFGVGVTENKKSMEATLLKMAIMLDELKSIIEKEVYDIKGNLEYSHYQKGEMDERRMSRIADRNDLVRINTLYWVRDVIGKMEQKHL